MSGSNSSLAVRTARPLHSLVTLHGLITQGSLDLEGRHLSRYNDIMSAFDELQQLAISTPDIEKRLVEAYRARDWSEAKDLFRRIPEWRIDEEQNAAVVRAISEFPTSARARSDQCRVLIRHRGSAERCGEAADAAPTTPKAVTYARRDSAPDSVALRQRGRACLGCDVETV